jgi:drug/metabolite transporter (DMT)-like permease
VGSVGFLPLLLFRQSLPLQIWPYALSSAWVETAYFVLLATAYRKGDFSVVYPMARGTAPALLAIWSSLFLNESLEAMGVIGLIILVLGLVLIGSSSGWTQQQQVNLTKPGVGSALLVALFISLYSIIDGAAVRQADPMAYTVLVLGLTTVFTTPIIFKRYGWKVLAAIWRAYWFRITLVGCFMFVAYMLVLEAYVLAPVGYAGAIREVSVVFAALAGWLWLGEDFGAIRVIGAMIIFLGVFIIAIAG